MIIRQLKVHVSEDPVENWLCSYRIEYKYGYNRPVEEIIINKDCHPKFVATRLFDSILERIDLFTVADYEKLIKQRKLFIKLFQYKLEYGEPLPDTPQGAA